MKNQPTKVNKKLNLFKIYNVIISLLAIISVTLIILDYRNTININQMPWKIIDRVILIIFAVDYFYRLFKADDKLVFFKNNIFDLLAIIPFDSIFSIFRITRLFRFLRLFRLFRLSGIIGKLVRNSKKFLNTNSLSWVLILSSLVLLISAMLYSISENVSFENSLWWAIATTTTVGYGDISPHTTLGKFAAVLLMFIGIGLIGSLTSSLTSYFSNNKDDDALKEISSKIDQLNNKEFSAADEILKFNDLLKAGIITEEEFKSEKEKILSQ